MNPNSSHQTDVPSSITIYQAAHDRRDVPTAVAQFAADARVVDDGRTYEGISGVESFVRNAVERAWVRFAALTMLPPSSTVLGSSCRIR